MKDTLKNTLKQIAFIACAAAFALAVAGCSVTKVNYERDENGVVSYRLYRNDHWLKTSASGLHGGMTNDGKFEFSADGMASSPSEEFNRTMQTYTTAFVQLAQIAAAAYNPSSSGVVRSSSSELELEKGGKTSTLQLETPTPTASTNTVVSSSAAPSAKEETSGSEAK